MATWTIQGESGKAWDATTVSFGSRKIEDGRFEFRSLDADTFSFTISAKDLSSETLPDLTQKLVIYRDGTRFFTGHVTGKQTSISAGQQVCSIVVSGPWWWMERIPFSASNTDGTGATADRLTLAFGTASSGQNLKTSIETAINRSVDLGVPIAKTTAGTPSTVATMTTFPRITLNQSTCGQVVAELVRCCADSMVYFDYSSATPTMHVTRRKSGLATGSASATTIDATGGTVTEIALNPMIELEVSRVELPYVTRDVQGRTQFATQTFGTASSPLPKTQILTVSGPELDTFLPNNLFDTYDIKTVAASSATDFVIERAGSLKEIAAEYKLAKLPLSMNTTSTLIQGYNLRPPNSNALFLTANPRPVPSFKGVDGTIYSSSTYKVVTTDSPPEWLKEDGTPVLIEATFSGSLYYTHVWDGNIGGTRYPIPAWWDSVGFSSDWFGTSSRGGRYFSDGREFFTAWYNFSIPCFITPTAYATTTTLYRAADYTFIAPPAGLAQFLKESQDFTPYEGQISTVEHDVGATRYRGTKVSVSNSLSEYSSMAALVAAESLDIKSGTTTISLGQPPRYDYRTLVDRIRKTSQDNIVYV